MRFLKVGILVLVCAFAAHGQILFRAQNATGAAPVMPNVTKIGQVNFATGSPYTFTASGNASVGDTVLFSCESNVYNSGTHYSFQPADSTGNTYTFTNGSTNTNLQFLDAGDTSAINAPMAVGITHPIVSGTTTFTLTVGVDTNTGGCTVLDVPGLLTSPLDQIAGLAAPFSTTQTSASITPSTQPEVVILIGAFNSAQFSAYGNIIGSAATGVDNRTTGSTGGQPAGLMIQWRRVTATTAGTGTYTTTGSGSGFGTLILSLKSN